MALSSYYKMSKPVKTRLNMMFLDERKTEFKKAFCEAEFHYEIHRRKKSIKVVENDDEG